MEKNTKEIILGTSKIDPRFRVTLILWRQYTVGKKRHYLSTEN